MRRLFAVVAVVGLVLPLVTCEKLPCPPFCPPLPAEAYDCENPPELSGRFFADPETLRTWDTGRVMIVLKKRADRSGALMLRPPTATIAASLQAVHEGLSDVVAFEALGQLSANADLRTIAAVLQSPSVDYIWPVQMFSVPEPIEAETTASWGTDRVNQRELPLDGNDDAGDEAEGIHVGVIDTGITDHSDFEGRLSRECFSATGEGCRDFHGHGTHCAGTIGGRRYGVAKGVTLHAVQVLGRNGSGSTEQLVAGINWLVRLADRLGEPVVGSMSLGGPADPPLDQAVCDALDAGVSFAIAAGNDYFDDARRSSPARVQQALTVAASDRADLAAGFSNVGPVVDLWAPGVSIVSAKPGGGWDTMSGTSMATPHVAGGLALYLSRHPEATPLEAGAALVALGTRDVIRDVPEDTANVLLYTREP